MPGLEIICERRPHSVRQDDWHVRFYRLHGLLQGVFATGRHNPPCEYKFARFIGTCAGNLVVLDTEVLSAPEEQRFLFPQFVFESKIVSETKIPFCLDSCWSQDRVGNEAILEFREEKETGSGCLQHNSFYIADHDENALTIRHRCRYLANESVGDPVLRSPTLPVMFWPPSSPFHSLGDQGMTCQITGRAKLQPFT